jgi:hypothetical protein
MAWGQGPQPPAGEPVKGTAEWIAKRDAILTRWDNAKKALDAAKDEEMEARKALVAFMSDPNKRSGTENIPLDNGYSLKVGKSLNYGWIKDASGKTDKAAIEKALSKIEKEAGELGKYITDNLVKWTPELSLTEYKKLGEQFPKLKPVIDTVIVTTDGAPKAEIVEPKTKQ